MDIDPISKASEEGEEYYLVVVSQILPLPAEKGE